MSELKKQKILFIPYTFTNGGGAEKVLQLLVNNLPSEKYEISIQEVEQFNKYLELQNHIKLQQALMNQKNPEKTFNELNYILLLYFPSILKYVFRLYGYDAVISFNYQLPSFMLSAFKNENKIAWFHGDLYDLQDKSKTWEKQKQHNVWNDVNKIVTISNKSQKSLYDLFPDFSNKLQIIHNGIDTKQIKEMAIETADIPESNNPFIVCVGRLDENKNFILAVRALAELSKQNINCSLVLVGEGNQHDSLMKEAEKIGISDKLIFAGFQNNPYKYISRSKLLCITSFSEGWPTVVMESMALGKPFVTTPVSGASEELAAGGQCGLVADYEPKKYAEAIKRLLINDDLYNQMSLNCLEHVKEYTAAKYAENFINLLREIEVRNNDTRKLKISFSFLVKVLLSYITYFISYIFSIGELLFRIQIICKRIKERRYVKILKNLIYFIGILVFLPVAFIPKCLYFPFYIRKIICKSGKKCR